jgi:hypothetical protein
MVLRVRRVSSSLDGSGGYLRGESEQRKESADIFVRQSVFRSFVEREGFLRETAQFD